MQYSALTLTELQSLGASGDEEALKELGRKVLEIDFDICWDGRICGHKAELFKLQNELASEIPPDCPHCGKFITDV